MKALIFIIIWFLISGFAISWKFFCPKCKEEGLKSKVYSEGCSKTAMATNPYFDEEGNYHSGDPNILWCSYACTNDHSITTANGKISSVTWKEGLIINKMKIPAKEAP